MRWGVEGSARGGLEREVADLVDGVVELAARHAGGDLSDVAVVSDLRGGVLKLHRASARRWKMRTGSRHWRPRARWEKSRDDKRLSRGRVLTTRNSLPTHGRAKA